MSSRPQLPASSEFNPSLFDFENDYLSLKDADLRYVRIGGDVYANTVNANALYLGGSLVDVSALSGITNGTALANKALVLDSNKDITAINSLSASSLTGTLQTASQPNITSLGTLTTLKLNGSFNFGANAQTTMNNNLIITGSASSPTTTNGLGFGFSPMVSTGRIRCYNYITSSFNNLDIHDSAIYVEGSNSNVGVGTSSLSSGKKLTVGGDTDIIGSLYFSGVGFSHGLYTSITAGTANASKAIVLSSNKDIGIIRRVTSQYINLQGQGSTDDFSNQGRLVNCIDSSMGNSTSRYITLGKAFSSKNSGEIAYVHSSDNSDDNRLSLGGYGFSDVLSVFANSTVSIGTTSRSSARMWVASGVGNSTITGSGNVQLLASSGFSQSIAPLTLTNPSARFSGHVWVDGATLYISSDRRIKENICDVDLSDAKRFVETVKPKKYNLKTRKDKQEYGYIAQDLLRQRFGELVDIQEDDTMVDQGDEYDLVGYRLSVDYQRVATLLHSVVNDLAERVSEIERKNHGHQNDGDRKPSGMRLGTGGHDLVGE